MPRSDSERATKRSRGEPAAPAISSSSSSSNVYRRPSAADKGKGKGKNTDYGGGAGRGSYQRGGKDDVKGKSKGSGKKGKGKFRVDIEDAFLIIPIIAATLPGADALQHALVTVAPSERFSSTATSGNLSEDFMFFLCIMFAAAAGIACGMLCFYMAWRRWCSGRQQIHVDVPPASRPGWAREIMVDVDTQTFFDPPTVHVSMHGERFHADPQCHGLRNAQVVSGRTPCQVCHRNRSEEDLDDYIRRAHRQRPQQTRPAPAPQRQAQAKPKARAHHRHHHRGEAAGTGNA
jgi:hypothetical protein